MKASNLIIVFIKLNKLLFMVIGQITDNTTPQPPLANQTAQQQPPPPALPPAQGGKTLKIAVPVTAYKEYVSLTYDSITGKPKFDGYSIQVFNAAINSVYPMNTPEISYNSYSKSDGTLNGTFDSMLQAVASQEYEGAVGDISIRYDRTQWVDFTLPYSDTGISMMVFTNQQPNKRTRIKVIMSLIKGFVYAAFGLCLGSAFIFWFVEFRNDMRRQSHTSLGSNTSLQRSNYNDEFWRRETLRAITHTRLVIVMWLLVLLFLTSCYTASLTSLITTQRNNKSPIRTLDELIRTNANVGVLTGSFIYRMLIEKGFSENQINSYSSEQEMIDMLSKGSDPGGIVAVIEEIAYLKVFLSNNCNKGYTLVSSFHINSEGFGFAFPKKSQLAIDISRGILKIMDNRKMTDIQRKTIGDPKTLCQDDSDFVGVYSNTLDVDTMWILFAGVIGVAILVIIVYMVYLGTICDSNRRRIAYPCYLFANFQERKS